MIRNSFLNDAYKVQSFNDLSAGLSKGNVYKVDDLIIIPRVRYPRWFVFHKNELKNIPLTFVTDFGKRAPQPSRSFEFNIITGDNTWVGFMDVEDLIDWLSSSLTREVMATRTSGLKRARSFRLYKGYKFRPFMATYVRPSELEGDLHSTDTFDEEDF